MGVSKKEPIIEIFVNEAKDSIRVFDKYMLEGVLKQAFERELVAEVTKIVHIIRLDSSMLLFDGISIVSGKLEKLLDCYRDSRAEEPDFASFYEVLKAYSEFIHGELYKLTHNEKLDGDITELVELIEHMDTGVVGFNKPKTHERHQYYIPSKTIETEEASVSNGIFDGLLLDINKNKDVFARPKSPSEVLNSLKNSLRSYNVTDEKMEELRKLSHNLGLKLLEDEANDYNKILGEFNNLLKNWIREVRMTDFSQVVTKAELIVSDLTKHTGKKVEFVVKGLEEREEPLLIEKYKIGNISKAITHLVRNAIDHGIETEDRRLSLGKRDRGEVRLKFKALENGCGVQISLRDDGQGISPDKILKAAEMKGILVNSKENYSIEDVMKIPFLTGFTTRKTVGDYSGRGVGLDAVAHLIEEIKGSIRLKSMEGIGTEIFIELFYDHVCEN